MTLEQNIQGQNDISLSITRGVEIKVGQIVPILQHSKCSGTEGTVKIIDLPDRTYEIDCNNCGSSVFLDVKSLVNPS